MGTRVDARDVDFIWSQATVIKVHSHRGPHIVVRFDGWDKSFDETLNWNDERFAPLHSFSKCVKCLVNLAPKKRGSPSEAELQALSVDAPRVYCNLWPCKVQFRMPHPVIPGKEDEEDCTNAQAFLAGETNIFVQPYEPHYLPLHLQHSLKENDGMWLSAKRVKAWMTNPLELGVLPEHFHATFRIAKNDKETPGVLPEGAIERGTLLKEEYQVHSRDGAQVRDGSLSIEETDEIMEEEEESVGSNEEEDWASRNSANETETHSSEAAGTEEPADNGETKEESWKSNCIIS